MVRTPYEIVKDAKRLREQVGAKTRSAEDAVLILGAYVEELAETIETMRQDHGRDVIELRQGIVNAQRAMLNELDKRLPKGKETLIQGTNPGSA